MEYLFNVIYQCIRIDVHYNLVLGNRLHFSTGIGWARYEAGFNQGQWQGSEGVETDQYSHYLFSCFLVSTAHVC